MKSICLVFFTFVVTSQLAAAGEKLHLTKGECALAIMSAQRTSDYGYLRDGKKPLPAPAVKAGSPFPTVNKPSLPWAQSRKISLWNSLTELLSDEAKEILADHVNDPKPTTIFIYTGINAMRWTSAATNLTQAVVKTDIQRLPLEESALEKAVGVFYHTGGAACFVTTITSPLLVCANCIAMGIACYTGALSWPVALSSAVLFPPTLFLGIWGSAGVFVSIDNWSEAKYKQRMKNMEDVARSSVAKSFSGRLAEFYEGDTNDTLISDLSPYDDHGSYNVRFIAERIPAEAAGYTDDDQLLIVIVQPLDEG